MSFLKFNKAELVNLEYSLKREILSANSLGAYCNTSIVCCNTRKYHGMLVVPIESFGDSKFVLLSSLDESLILNGKQFNLGIHCYSGEYDPKGHKYIVDFTADDIPTLTYKVGPIVLKKSMMTATDKNQTLVKYTLESAPGKVSLNLKPFLAFRSIHELTKENHFASPDYETVPNGVQYCLYQGFPALSIQTNIKSEYRHQPYWYNGVTYTDEYQKGYDCREDLLVPGVLSVEMKPGDEIIVSVATSEINPRTLKAQFEKHLALRTNIGSHYDVLMDNVYQLKVLKRGKKMINAGYAWLETGLLRETVQSLPGLTLYAGGNCKEFEEILDNLIEAEGERLYRKTTQIEAPLAMTDAIQQYIAFSGKEKEIWAKYGAVFKCIIESYGRREEAIICPNGLLWCQKDRTALTWMNTYVNGYPVNERPGFQVETNAFWYNALCFAIDMEAKYGSDNAFIEKWSDVRNRVKENFAATFITTRRGYHMLADYVDSYGQHTEVRPNMLWAAYLPYSVVDEEVQSDIVASINRELVTRRGIRTLSPSSNDYKGVYEGMSDQRSIADFNGCTHTALLGPYIDLCFRMIGPAFCGKAKWLTEGFFEDINKHGVGAFSELYDGDPPHEPHGAISSATATAALMRCIYLMEKNREDKQ